jgi:hypothetical protein
MNLREGTRRLALLLGVVGAICGGVASYFELQTVLTQWEQHNKFVQLSSSDTVRQERKKCQASGSPLLNPAMGEPIHGRAKLSDVQPIPSNQSAQQIHGPWEKYAQPASSGHIAEYDAQGNPISSQPDQGEIKTIHWTKDFRVESMETEDGQTLYPTKTPAAYLYILIALFPILGFLIPWGSIHAIRWVGIGFVKVEDNNDDQ